MSNTAIVFRFEDEKSAAMANDMFQELGYDPAYHTDADRRSIHIHLDGDDLTSALEIAQAYGGQFIEEASYSGVETDKFDSIYGLDQIPIPAHIVNEDLPQLYAGQDEESYNEQHL